MRLHIGAIPQPPDFAPDASWHALKEPSPWMAQPIALPIGVSIASCIAVLWFVITPLSVVAPTHSVWAVIGALLLLIVLHELVHTAAHPNSGLSPRSILGFWPSRLLCYAHYDGELTRRRFVVILLMPLIVISIVPLVVSAIAQITSGWLAYISSANALMACMDVLGAGMLMYQVPRNAILRNQGWKTYWRVNDGGNSLDLPSASV